MLSMKIPDKKDLKPLLILLSVPILLVLYLYYGKHQAFLTYLPQLAKPPLGEDTGYIYEFLGSFFLLFLVPVILLIISFKDKLRNYGFTAGDWKTGIRITLISMFVLIPG